MLLFLEEQVQGGQLQGVQLVTVLDDFTLTHLLTLVKNNGLCRRFGNVVKGFTSLESVWDLKMNSAFDIRQFYGENNSL